MAVLSTTLGASFTPAASSFIVQVNGGAAMLERRNSAAAAWSNRLRIESNQAVTIENPVAGADYRVTAIDSSPVTFSADQ